MSEAPKETVGDGFRTLWNLGYRYLVPVVPFNGVLSPRSHLAKRKGDVRGKAPGLRGSDGEWYGLKGWQTATPTEADLATWFSMGAGVGLRLGLQHDGTYLFAVDADTLDRKSAETVAAEVQARFGLVPVRIGRSPKALYLIRCRGPLPYRSLVFEHGCIEVLGEGKQCVIVGIHPVTLLPYRITRPAHGGLPALAALPIQDASDIDGLLSDLSGVLPKPERVYGEHGITNRASVDQERLKGDLELVRKAVEAIPNRYPADGYAWWIKMAAAVRGACQEDDGFGLELFEEFSERADMGGADAAESATRVYRSINAPFAVGASLLFEWAEERSEGRFGRSDLWFDGDAAAEVQKEFGGGDDGTNRFLEGVGAKPAKLRLELLSAVAETALTVAARPLVKGLLDCGAMTILYGESNTGKTFAAMDLAFHVASGRPWGGMRTAGLPVVYVVAEGGNGARKRAAALIAKYGPCDGFHFVLSPVNLLDPAADLGPLIALLKSVDGLGLVVLDTLSRVMAGGDENSSVDMGALVRHLDAIRAVTGAHVLVVHHTGKDTAKGARGHSLLRAATDTEIEVTVGCIGVTKQRDLDKEYVTGFDLVPVTLGVDGEGDPVTSCTVSLRPMTRGGLSVDQGRQEEALEVLRGHVWREDVRSPDWVGIPIAGVLGLPIYTTDDKRAVSAVVEKWIAEGVLEKQTRGDKLRRPRVYVTVKASVFD
ncbi:hypothetical protein ASF22_02605 [Methylobacterium sp. Leaf87]|uniref:AAA family ATPase n=1 Tax=Methylobacterium sp. Leaf87 TaxID=1736243 RepID=UPI0006F40876|nr:AAA family ATPase [Methylobacterium sp. Leaf87]KQO69518.1 hypothetical protein ASF22_02605 [Methylobacterium sp. Leaf87]